mmetsp:Transcript_54610/g.109822  ORF Transcript_54610/g.109822 Transcript_54610/m.109822 type:complete len:92 (-) Transcript_54610:397-672(-)
MQLIIFISPVQFCCCIILLLMGETGLMLTTVDAYSGQSAHKGMGGGKGSSTLSFVLDLGVLRLTRGENHRVASFELLYEMLRYFLRHGADF